MIKAFFLSLFLLCALPIDGALGETRGIRNYNPANLVRTSIPWQGKRRECSDTRFECFTTPYHGLRAMYKTLYSYYYKHNLKSIREIMHRWSPSHENDTEVLIRRVERRMAWDSNRAIPIRDSNFIHLLGRSLIINENGRDPYTHQLHRSAIKNAFRNINNVR